MITRIIFEDDRFQDDGLYVYIEWNQGASFNIWVNGENVDVFTAYGDNTSGAYCTLAQAEQYAREHFDDMWAELTEDDE